MKQILSGTGADTTATVMAWLKAHKQIHIADLYLIGEDDDPRSLWFTDYSTPLVWPLWGTFLSTRIKRGPVASKIGLEAESLDLEWSPKNATLTSSLATASPYQLARLGVYDNWRVRVWRCYMPTPGDASTWGAMELYAGWLGDCQVERGVIKFQVNSYLYALDQKVPSGIIESSSTLASYSAGEPPSGYDTRPVFKVQPGSTPTLIYGVQQTPFANARPSDDAWKNYYLVFMGVDGGTLRGAYSIIARNFTFSPGFPDIYAAFQLYSPLPWAPATYTDEFYVVKPAPINSTDAGYAGFPYVPAPETAA
jgi:hypothetical protein